MKHSFKKLLIGLGIFGLSLAGCNSQDKSSISSIDDRDPKILEIYEAYKADGGTLEYEEWLNSIRGADGSLILCGISDPASETGKNGDIYINTETWDIFIKNGGVWSKIGNIMGREGPAGQDGQDGQDGKDGEDGKDGKDGEDGKDGVDGKDGTSVLNGNGEPLNSLGKDGDVYIDLDTWNFYLKVNGEWVLNGCLKGESGDPSNPTGLAFYLLDDGTYAVGAGLARELSNIVIPDEYNGKPVTKIAANGFADLENLKSITLPNSIKTIGAKAFYNSTLESIVIPDSVTEAGTNCFAETPSLKTVTIGSGLTTISEKMFYNSGLLSVTIPNNITIIGNKAFSRSTNLETVNIGIGVTSINEETFYCCFALTTLNYSGTIAQWKALQVGARFISSTLLFEINCSDGIYDDFIDETTLPMPNPLNNYHLVGGFEGTWMPSDSNKMEPASFKDIYNFDNGLARDLLRKDVVYLYKVSGVEIGTKNDTGYTVKALIGDEVRTFDGSAGFKVTRSYYEEDTSSYIVEQWITDPHNANAEALTDNIFIPIWQEQSDQYGFDWADTPVITDEGGGTYTVFIAKYNNHSTATQAEYGFAAFKTA